MLAFSAVLNHDRVGAVLFSDRIEGYVPPGRGRDHALAHRPRPARGRAARPRHRHRRGGLRFAQRVMKRRGIIAAISDFQGEGYEKGLGILRRRHDVIALHLADPREREFPDAGLIALIDPETGERGRRGRLAARTFARTSRPRRCARRPRSSSRTRVDALTLSTVGVVRKAAVGVLQGARERRR